MVTLCVEKTATKLLERNPINSVVVRTARVFNPPLITPENKGALLKMMKPLKAFAYAKGHYCYNWR